MIKTVWWHPCISKGNKISITKFCILWKHLYTMKWYKTSIYYEVVKWFDIEIQVTWRNFLDQVFSFLDRKYEDAQKSAFPWRYLWPKFVFAFPPLLHQVKDKLNMLKYHPFHYQTFFCSFSFFNFPSLSLLYILVYIRIFQCEQAHFQLINSRLFYVKRGIYYKRLVYIINTWCEPRFNKDAIVFILSPEQ